MVTKFSQINTKTPEKKKSSTLLYHSNN